MTKEILPDKQKVLKAMAALCSRKEHCSSDIYNKLIMRNLTLKDCAEIMATLIQHKFIDDTRFAKSYALDKFRFNHWGPNKIKAMLHGKGIGDDIIEIAMQPIEGEASVESCTELLRKKRQSIKSENLQEIKVKLFRFALSRGFHYEIINQAIGKVL